MVRNRHLLVYLFTAIRAALGQKHIAGGHVNILWSAVLPSHGVCFTSLVVPRRGLMDVVCTAQPILLHNSLQHPWHSSRIPVG